MTEAVVQSFCHHNRVVVQILTAAFSSPTEMSILFVGGSPEIHKHFDLKSKNLETSVALISSGQENKVLISRL